MEQQDSSKLTRRELKRQMKHARRASEGAKKTVKKIVFTVIVIGAIGGLAVWFFVSVFGMKPGIQVPILSRDHVKPEDKHEPYLSNPPTSGPHYATWSKCDIFEEPVAVETLLHNMEHGQVVVLYKPDLDPAEVQKLKDFVSPKLDDGWILMAQNADIPNPIALASWGWYQLFDVFDETNFTTFYKVHKHSGPERIPCAS